LKEQDLIRLAELTGTLRSHYYFDSIVPIAPLLGVIEEHIENSGLSAPLRSALKEMHRRVAPYVSVADNRRAASLTVCERGGQPSCRIAHRNAPRRRDRRESALPR